MSRPVEDPDYPMGTAGLPSSWRVTYLGLLTQDLRSGFSTKEYNEQRQGVAHLRPMNITTKGEILLDQVKYVEPTSSLRAVKGDILFNNTNSRDLVGKSALLDLDGEWAFSNHITRIRVPPELFIPEFVSLQLQFLWRSGYFRLRAKQHVNQASISTTRLRDQIPIVVAPIGEQQRIVAEVNGKRRMLGGVEAAVASALKTLASYESHVIKLSATLTLLVDEDDASLRNTVKVSDAGEVQLGKMRSPKSHTGPNMKPYLRVANVLENEIDFSDIYSMHFSEAEVEKYSLRAGDILLNEGQSPELVGRPAMYDGSVEGCCFQKTLLRFRPRDGVSSNFALLVFRHYLRSGAFRSTARWTTNLAHLTAVRFAAMDFPLPPLEVQERTAEEAVARLQRIETCRNLLANIARRVELARTAILREAFRSTPNVRVPTVVDDEGPSPRRAQTPTASMRSTRSERRVIAALGSVDDRLSPEELYTRAGFNSDSIDEFYDQLRSARESGLVREDRLPDGTVTLRRLASE